MRGVLSYHIGPIEGELSATVPTTLESFGQHKLSHPVNAFLAGLDSKVVRLPTIQKHGLAVNKAAPIGRGNQGE